MFDNYNWYQLWYGESCSRRTTCLFLMHLLVPTNSRLFLPLRLSHIIQLGRELVSPDGDEINVKCSFTLFPMFSSLSISFHWDHSVFGCILVLSFKPFPMIRILSTSVTGDIGNRMFLWDFCCCKIKDCANTVTHPKRFDRHRQENTPTTRKQGFVDLKCSNMICMFQRSELIHYGTPWNWETQQKATIDNWWSSKDLL